MRVLFVAQEYPPETAHGGIATQTHAKAHGLAARGHEVVVLSAASECGATDHRDGRVRVVRIAPHVHLPPRSEVARGIAWSVAVAAAIEALHGAQPFDLVEFADYGAEGLAWLANLDRSRGAPVTTIHVQGPIVMLAHTVGWPDPASDEFRLATDLERACLRRADAVYAAGANAANWVAGSYGLDRALIPVLHVGVDTTRFAPDATRRAHQPTVLCVGKVARSKGADALAEAALELVADLPELRVRFVGRVHDGALVDAMTAAAAEAGCPRLFEFAGQVPHADLPRELTAAHVFAAPSLVEGGPAFACLEAMACGLPVVACAGSGVDDSLRDGEHGALVGRGDVGALVAALRRLLREPGRSEAIGRRAREHVLATAERKRCVDAIERHLVGVLARHRPAARAGRLPRRADGAADADALP